MTMYSVVSTNKMNGKSVHIQPSLRVLWKCSSSQHLKQMSMESEESDSEAEGIEESKRHNTMKRQFKRTIIGLNNDRGLPLKSNTEKCFQDQRCTSSKTEIASLEPRKQDYSKTSIQVEDNTKKESDNVGISFNNSRDVSTEPDTTNHKDSVETESSNAAGDETTSKLHHSDKASTLTALEIFSGNIRPSVNKKLSIFTKIPHVTQQSVVIANDKDMGESSFEKNSAKAGNTASSWQMSDKNPSHICQDKVPMPVISENIGPSSAGEACTYISQEIEDKEPHYEVQTQALSCKAGTSDHLQSFKRWGSFSNHRTGSSVTLNFDRSRSRVLNPRVKRPDVPKTFIDRGVQACRAENGKSPSRLENKVNILESRIRLEELRSRHWITRVIAAEKSLLKLCEQLQTLDQAMKTLKSSHVPLQEKKSSSGLDNISPQDTLKVTSALHKNATPEKKHPVNNTPV